MKKQSYKIVIWSMLVALILIAIPSAIRLAPEMVGKRYVDTYQFQQEMEGFYNTLGATVLNPIELEEAKKKLIVTADEIEEHRMRYGYLSEQIQNIQDQYEDQIWEAEEAGNDRVKESLIKERDQKIEDVELNFESDEHVKEKIIAEKVAALKEFIANTQQRSWSSFPVAYELTDIKTGETFSRGEVDVSTFYEKKFDEESPLKARSSMSGEDETTWDAAVSQYEVNLSEIQNPIREFTGRVVVSEKAMEASHFNNHLKQYNYKKYRNYTLWVLSIVALILLFTKLRFRKEWIIDSHLLARYETLKVDMKVLIFIVALFIVVEMMIPNATSYFYYNDVYRGAWSRQLFSLIALTVGVMWLTIQLVFFVERWKVVGRFEEDLAKSYAVQFLKAIRDMFLNRTLGIQFFILLIGFFLAGIGFAVVIVQPFALVIYFPAVMLLGLPALFLFARRAAYLNRILVSAEKMANGMLYEDIKAKGKSPLAKHAENLNRLREGVQISMNEQAKSERLKTELITNVSHDLRTPLTSIITYTDLLKAKDLPEEDRLKYVDILDKKSARLKTLIEDLFEVSKMASGNLELHKNQVNLTQLLQQALAEHEEEISNSSLDFRIQLPEKALIASVDGQKWWRVLDNLIVNALKYSMVGTRVYINLDQVGNRAQFIVKNISKYELSENSDELFERFKRADTSRHTDGSGLGLAIAQSIVDMHGGEMKIDIDGDLFKVTVELPVS